MSLIEPRLVIAGHELSHSHIQMPQDQTVNYAWGYNANNEPIHVNPGIF